MKLEKGTVIRINSCQNKTKNSFFVLLSKADSVILSYENGRDAWWYRQKKYQLLGSACSLCSTCFKGFGYCGRLILCLYDAAEKKKLNFLIMHEENK